MGESDKNVEYRIREDIGLIICKLWGCENLAINKICEHMDIELNIREEYLINEAYVGVAQCSPFSKFNLKYGKRLALERAQINRNKAINKMVEYYVSSIRNCIDNLENDSEFKNPDSY